MTRYTQYQCDRCSETFQDKPTRIACTRTEEVEKYGYKQNRAVRQPHSGDLCPSCAEYFRKWWMQQV